MPKLEQVLRGIKQQNAAVYAKRERMPITPESLSSYEQCGREIIQNKTTLCYGQFHAYVSLGFSEQENSLSHLRTAMNLRYI